MRIEKPFSGLYQAKVAQDQIEVVSNDLIASTGVLNNTIAATSGTLNGQITIVSNNLISASASLQSQMDTLGNYVRVRSFSNIGTSVFYTNATSTIFVTGSNVTATKKYSSSELRVSVNLLMQADLQSNSSMNNADFAYVAYSVNGGSTWLGETLLKLSSMDSSIYYNETTYILHFNLGQLPSGNVDFRIGVRRGSFLIPSDSIYVFPNYSYLFIEALENA